MSARTAREKMVNERNAIDDRDWRRWNLWILDRILLFGRLEGGAAVMAKLLKPMSFLFPPLVILGHEVKRPIWRRTLMSVQSSNCALVFGINVVPSVDS